jgi:superfamily II DNA or RNA helicase
MAFCSTVAHSQAVASAFSAAGYRAIQLDGATPRLIRDRVMEDYRAGAYDVMAQCDLLGEGVDVPGIECAILLRPTRSLTIYLQSIGRCLRPALGKDRAIILDHAGNWLRHGLPADERVWTLDAKRRKKSDEPPDPRLIRCPECMCVYTEDKPKCPECGALKPVVERVRKISSREGDLHEISADVLWMLRHGPPSDALQWARDEAGVRLIAKMRGYKRGWVRHVMRGREAAAARSRGGAGGH